MRSAESLKCIVESVSVRRRFEAVHADATNGAQMVRVLGESYATSGATGAAALAIALNLVPL